ncbi:hypothetical protein SDC9_116342 [bioreactor metagenome]|uniref:Uncharacterized protein n=1 Tax=bioreactor metagenome TaxID=1076179 RepID=A0A645BW32_9ZZZZ
MPGPLQPRPPRSGLWEQTRRRLPLPRPVSRTAHRTRRPPPRRSACPSPPREGFLPSPPGPPPFCSTVRPFLRSSSAPAWASSQQPFPQPPVLFNKKPGGVRMSPAGQSAFPFSRPTEEEARGFPPVPGPWRGNGQLRPRQESGGPPPGRAPTWAG